MNKEEYKKWRKQQMELPLAELIAKPNCNFDCPEGRPFSCGCKECFINGGFWSEGEKEERFTEKEIRMIDCLFEENIGYLREDGCVLERKFRPEKCLRHVCDNRFTKIAG